MEELCPGIGKWSWPELVGKNGKEAAEIIEKENTNVEAFVIDRNAITLPVVDCKRVYVRVNDYGIVVEVPTVG